MLTQEQNDRLTRIGPGTPMGEVFRRYWQPIASAGEFDDEPVKQVTILGETLVLYRDRQGRLGLIGERCPHQGIAMVYGIPDWEGLRCAYHGWTFDQTGACVDLGEDAMTPNADTFKESVRMPAYRVEELGGLIFAYMGPEPAPLLPRWEPLVMPGVWRSVASLVAPCNWLQCMENQVGDTHVEWLHGRFRHYAEERLGRAEERVPSEYVGRSAAPDFNEFERFEFGMLKRRANRDNWGGEPSNREVARVAEDGAPIVLPNMQIRTQIQYFVPIDDTHTWALTYRIHRVPKELGIPEQQRVPIYELPLPGIDEQGHPTWSLLDNNQGQDRLVLYARGGIADRTQENLGTGSKGIVLLRELLEENIQRVQRGEDPIGTVRDPAVNERLLRSGDDGADGDGRRLSRPDPYDPAEAELRALIAAKT